jgi:hypothetical protein
MWQRVVTTPLYVLRGMHQFKWFLIARATRVSTLWCTIVCLTFPILVVQPPHTPHPKHGGNIWALPPPHPQGLVNSKYIYILTFEFTQHHILATPMYLLKGMHKYCVLSHVIGLRGREVLGLIQHIVLHIIITMHLLSLTMSSPRCQPPATPLTWHEGEFWALSPPLCKLSRFYSICIYILNFWVCVGTRYCNTYVFRWRECNNPRALSHARGGSY